MSEMIRKLGARDGAEMGASHDEPETVPSQAGAAQPPKKRPPTTQRPGQSQSAPTAADGTAGTPRRRPSPGAKRRSASRPAAASRGDVGSGTSAKAADGAATPRTQSLVASVRRVTKDAEAVVVDRLAPLGRKASSVTAAAGTQVRTARERAGRAARRASQDIRTRSSEMAGSAKSLATSPGARMVGIAMAGVALGLLANLGRKAMVQAPTALSGDWLEGVKAEHRLALALFDQIEQTADHAAGRRAALLLQLKHALGKHAFTEENVIYPALRQWRDQEDADRLTHDHGYVKQYLFELEAMPKDDPGFLAKVATFRSKLEEHIRDEETVIFPPLHDVLGPDGNARITALANKEGFKLA